MSKLFIICGHGAGDPGATGNGYTEAERVRALAKRIKEFGGDNVIIGDMSKNWYQSNLVNNNNIPKGSLVLELHMDYAAPSAKGAHIIVDANLNADKHDEALAKFISGIFPGRASVIVKRNDLANPNRAQYAGINYRLLECGFISNANDVKTFNSRMDEIARGILKCFDITAENQVTNEKKDEVVNKPDYYRVQVGAFSDYEGAENLAEELKAKGYGTYIVEIDGMYKVQVGAYSNRSGADNMVKKLNSDGYEAFVTIKVGNPVKKTEASFKIGDRVTLQKNAPIYGTTAKFQNWVYNSALFVRGIYNDKIIISINKAGAITGAVDKKYLIKI